MQIPIDLERIAQIVRARRNWKCDVCGRTIPRSSLYAKLQRFREDRDGDRFCWPCLNERRPEIVNEYHARRVGGAGEGEREG